MKKFFFLGMLFSLIISANLNSQTPIHTRGAVVELDNNFFVVDTVKYYFTDSTLYKFPNDSIVKKSNILLGTNVDVKGYKYSQKNYAKDIIIDDGSGFKDVEIKGTVNTIFTGVIIVDGNTFAITDTTNIFYFNGDLAHFDSIKVGDKVELYAKNYNSESIAINIRILNGTINTVSLKNAVTSIASDYFIMNGRKFFVNSTSVLQFKTNKTAKLKEIFNNDTVYVNAKFENYQYNIVKATINKAKDTSSAKGLNEDIKQVGNNFEITINNNKYVFKKAYSDFYSNDVNIKKIDQVKSNFMLLLKIAKFDNDNTKYIETLTVLHEKSGSTKIKGTIYANEYNKIVVDNNIVEVIDTTYIVNESGMPQGIPELYVSRYVEIDADIFNNQIIAQKILIKKEPEASFSIKGIVELKEQNSITINKKKIDVLPGVNVYMTNSGKAIFDDIKPGQLLELECKYENSSVVAKKMFIINSEFSNALTVVDTVQSKTKYGFYIQDNLVTISSQSTIKNFDGEKATLSDIKQGSLVRVIANKIYTGYVAYFIEILDKPLAEKFRVAYAATINKDTLVTSWYYLITDAQTKYYYYDKTPASLSKIKFNDKLMIEYYNNNNTYYAKKIYILNDYVPNNYSVLGTVSSKTSTDVSIDDEKYNQKYYSKIFDKSNALINLNKLDEKSLVEIRGMYDGKNFVNLYEIQLDGETYPDSLKTFDGKGDNYLVVGGRFYYVDANTKYFNKAGNPISFVQLTDNLKLQVKARFVNNIRYAKEVRVLDGTSSVDNESKDNAICIYPNPAISKFNIKFNKQDENVNVKVIDVLGNTLLEQTFAYISEGQILNIENKFNPGVYIVQINSKNHNTLQKLILK